MNYCCFNGECPEDMYRRGICYNSDKCEWKSKTIGGIKRQWDIIHNLNLEEFAEWLDNFSKQEMPYDWFDEKYCKKCKPVEGVREDGVKVKIFPCEFNECPVGFINSSSVEIIKMWLESAKENNTND